MSRLAKGAWNQLVAIPRERSIDTSVTIPPDGGYGWVITFSAFVVCLFQGTIMYSHPIFSEQIAKSFGAKMVDITVAMSIMDGVYNLTGPIASSIVNRFGFRCSCLVGTILSGTALYLVSKSNHTYLVQLCFGGLLGVGFGLMLMGGTIAVNFYFERWRAIAMSIAVSGTGIGTMVGPILNGKSIRAYGWRKALFYEAIVIYLAGFVASQLMRPLKPTLLVIVETEQTYDDKKKKVKTVPIQPAVQPEDHAPVKEFPDQDPATSDPKRKVQFTGGTEEEKKPATVAALAPPTEDAPPRYSVVVLHPKDTEAQIRAREARKAHEHAVAEWKKQNKHKKWKRMPRELREELRPPSPATPAEKPITSVEARSSQDGPRLSIVVTRIKSDSVIDIPVEEHRRHWLHHHHEVGITAEPIRADRFCEHICNRCCFLICCCPSEPNTWRTRCHKFWHCFDCCCHSPEPRPSGPHVSTAASARPMARDDIFLGANLNILPEYKKIEQQGVTLEQGQDVTDQDISRLAKQNVPYHMQVTRVQVIPSRGIGPCAWCFQGVICRAMCSLFDFKPLKKKSFAALATSGIFIMLGSVPVYMFIVARAKDVLMLTGDGALTLVPIIGGANFCGRIICGMVTTLPHIKALEVMRDCLFICGSCTLLSELMCDFPGQVIFAAIFGFTVSSTNSLITIVIVDLVGLENLSSCYGMFLLFKGVGGISCAALSSLLVRELGLQWVFRLSGLSLILATILLTAVKPLAFLEHKKTTEVKQFRAFERERNVHDMNVQCNPADFPSTPIFTSKKKEGPKTEDVVTITDNKDIKPDDDFNAKKDILLIEKVKPDEDQSNKSIVKSTNAENRKSEDETPDDGQSKEPKSLIKPDLDPKINYAFIGSLRVDSRNPKIVSPKDDAWKKEFYEAYKYFPYTDKVYPQEVVKPKSQVIRGVEMIGHLGRGLKPRNIGRWERLKSFLGHFSLRRRVKMMVKTTQTRG